VILVALEIVDHLALLEYRVMKDLKETKAVKVHQDPLDPLDRKVPMETEVTLVFLDLVVLLVLLDYVDLRVKLVNKDALEMKVQLVLLV